MGQVLYAIGAMMMATMLATYQQQSVLRSQMRLVENEISTQASGVAVDLFERIGEMAFDEVYKTGLPITLPSQLSAVASFGGNLALDLCDDIDDVHGMKPYSYQVSPQGQNGPTLNYTVTAEVEYVSIVQGEVIGSQSPTFSKEVTLTIQNDYLVQPVKLSRVFYPKKS